MLQTFYWFWPRKNQKWPKPSFLTKDVHKIKFVKIFGQHTKSKNFGQKIFFGRNRFWMFRNVFYTKNLEIENFFWDLVIFGRNTKKWQSLKFLVDFFVWIDSECFKTYFKTKLSKLKIFSRSKNFMRPSHFLPKMVKDGRNSSRFSFVPV